MKAQKPTVIIKRITNRNRALALRLELYPHQVEWVPPVSETLKRIPPKSGPAPAESFGIYSGRVMAGFFAVAGEPRHPHICFLFGFLIDRHYQNQGWGAQVLDTIIHMILERYPDRPRIRITLHPENSIAPRLYWNAGFRPTGEWLEGQAVWEKS